MNKLRKIFILLVVSLSMLSCGKAKHTDMTITTDKNVSNDSTSDESVNTTTISGEFTVGVRDVIPDYCFDSETSSVAIVTEFQSYPFTIFVGEDIASQLEVNNVYVFTIKPFDVNNSIEELQEMNLSSIVWEFSALTIKEFRLAEEHELGLGSLQLTFTEIEN